jgi:two-component system LytT family response regulator
MGAIRTLVVDDEAPARRKVKLGLSDLPDVEVVGECADGQEALNFLRSQALDLLFLDVQMPRLSGFDVVREMVGRVERLPVIIFSTAYDEFAIRAFEVNAVDYLLKPYSRERLHLAVARAREHILLSEKASDLREALQTLLGHVTRASAYSSRLAIKSNDSTVFILTQDIDWVSAADNYLELHFRKETRIIRKTMSQIEKQLDPTQFVRIHRSTMVNISCIKEMKHLFNKDYVAILRDGTQLVVSRTYIDKLMNALKMY